MKETKQQKKNKTKKQKKQIDIDPSFNHLKSKSTLNHFIWIIYEFLLIKIWFSSTSAKPKSGIYNKFFWKDNLLDSGKNSKNKNYLQEVKIVLLVKFMKTIHQMTMFFLFEEISKLSRIIKKLSVSSNESFQQNSS